MTDSQILELYRDGHREEAFTHLVKKYGERLYWQIRPLCPNHEDADDLVQDIFMKIWTALPSFRGEAQLFTWCWRIATNTAISFMKKQKLSGSVLLSGESSRRGDSARPSPLDIVSGDPYFDGDRAQALLQAAVLSLPPRQRMVFTMRYYEEMSYEDMSRILGTSVSSLKASYHFAQEKIRRFVTRADG